MTDSDLTVRAAKALREAHTGAREGSGFTRARIMNTLHRERRRRLLRWAIGSPLVSVLLVGSAWAQSSGKWPVIWQAVASVFVAAPMPAAAPRPHSKQDAHERPRPRVEPPAVDAPATVPAPTDASNSPEPEPEALPAAPLGAEALAERGREAASPAARPRRRVRAPSRSAPEPEPSPARAEALPERDRELARFRVAHDLHFSGDRPGAAIDAYAAYLREYPAGRFVPEARYNGALDQIKLGNTRAARDALDPFAAGQYGSYRQKEARELLDALANKSGVGR